MLYELETRETSAGVFTYAFIIRIIVRNAQAIVWHCRIEP